MKLCGEQSMKNVVIVTNMWNMVSSTEGQCRAAELQFMGDFFKPAFDQGAWLMHHTHETVDSAHQIIRSIIVHEPQSLAIQEELADKHMEIDQTAVGLEVSWRIADRIAGYEKKLRELIEMMEWASRNNDEETRAELLEESPKVQAAISKLEEERVGHPLAYKRLRVIRRIF